MASIPNMRTAKLTRIDPIFFLLSFLEKSRNATPITASTGEKELGFNNLMKKLSLWIPERLKIQAVIVVPILAPKIIPTA